MGWVLGVLLTGFFVVWCTWWLMHEDDLDI
jgi:predicted outer membrane lipoprotein